jgi:fructokinase
MTLITCIGEALIDFLPLPGDGRTAGFGMHAGGSSLNVAVAAARLGRPAALAGKVSTDYFGRYLRAYVETEGVDVRWLIPADSPTTLAFVALESGDPVFSFYGQGAADTLLSEVDLPDALFQETTILQVGSISLLRGTTPGSVLAACQRMAGTALISLDPNVRPDLVADEPAYRSLLHRLAALADIVKVSAADLAWLAPHLSTEEAAATLLAEGPALIVATRGSRHVLALRARPGGHEAVRVAAFPVEVVDTVGAGDALNAGLLSWLADRGVTSRVGLDGLATEDLTSALRFAAAVAALNCTRAGADPPDRAIVDAFLSSVGSSAT